MTDNTSKALVLSTRGALNNFLGANQDKIKNKFPLEYRRLLSASTFCSTVLAMFDKTPKLYGCTPDSIRSGLEKAALLGMDFHPDKGQCYLVPFRNNTLNVIEAVFVIGWRGMITQAFRSGVVTKIEARLAYENEPFEVIGGTAGMTIIHKLMPPHKRGEKIIAGYATAHLANGEKLSEIMWFEELEKVRKISKMANAGAWKDWKEQMFLKVPIRRLYKYLPQVTDNALVLETIRLDNENYTLEEVEAVVVEDGDKTRNMSDKLKDKELPATEEEEKKKTRGRKLKAKKEAEPVAKAEEKKEQAAPTVAADKGEPPPPSDEDAPAPTRQDKTAEAAAATTTTTPSESKEEDKPAVDHWRRELNKLQGAMGERAVIEARQALGIKKMYITAMTELEAKRTVEHLKK